MPTVISTLMKEKTIMKTNVLITALAAMAMMVPGTAMARQNDRQAQQHRNHRIEHRTMHHAQVPMHRHPTMGTRVTHRPLNGRHVMVNRERLWLADGVLYRLITTRQGSYYIVVGYYR